MQLSETRELHVEEAAVEEAVVEEASAFLVEGAGRRIQQRRSSALKATALVSVAALVAACSWLRSAPPAAARHGDFAHGPVELDATPCHTTVEGERCFKDVHWAMGDGIVNHPEWYTKKCPDLLASSSVEDFQECVYILNRESCPSRPCPASGTPAPAGPQPVQVPPSLVQAVPADGCSTAQQGDPCYDAVARAVAEGHAGHAETLEGVQEAVHRFNAQLCPQPCKCHTAVEGEACYAHIQYAMNGGLGEHAYWYVGLRADSSFTEVQEYLHKKNACPRPCGDRPAASAGTCRTTRPGEACYKNVLYGMRRGLFEHSEWYPGLNTYSSFEEFQDVLHSSPDLECPKPCECKTAKIEDKCYSSVKWVFNEGIEKHPGWYPGIKASSRWEVVQQRLHEENKTKCAKPCSPKIWGTPSLFCFSIFRSTGYEVDLVKSQIQKGVGIFSCDEFAVLSDRELEIYESVKTLIIPPCEKVGVSKDGTAANTQIFLNAWQVIKDDARYKAHDWVIKADPDAVVLVDRMRTHLAGSTGQNVFIQNCMKYTGPGWPTMFGSLEAISVQALETYFSGSHRCTTELEWESWGEDLFMNNCLVLLGVKPVFDGRISGDKVCKGVDCSDGISAAYHAFKSSDAWFQCYMQATGVDYFRRK